MSVGHVTRALEAAGLPTVTIIVEAFSPKIELMKLPRVVSTKHPMGRPMGAPGDVETQRSVLEEAFQLLESATGPTTVTRPDQFKPGHVR